jgi:hypothetical protein
MKLDSNSKRLAWICVAIALFNLFLLAATLIIGPRFNVLPSAFYRDPNVVAHQSFSIGALSNLGAVGWIVAATTALFAAIVAQGEPARPFLITLGALTAALGTDDLFMVHEGLLPFLRLPESIMYILYASLTVIGITKFRKQIMQTPWGMIAAALVCLGVSVVLDLITDKLGFHNEGTWVVEDALKLLGISFWTMYTCYSALKATQASVDREKFEVEPGDNVEHIIPASSHAPQWRTSLR